MPRFHLLLLFGLVLAIVLLLAVRWLWRQRRRSATFARRCLIVIVGTACPALLVLLAGGLQLLWHERPHQPVTVTDLRILERADAILGGESSWNRNDDKQCDDDDAARRWSLYCAMEAACRDVVGGCAHTHVASQEVRFAIEEVAPGEQFEGRLMGFNNLPATRFEDIKRVLRMARQRVHARMEQREARR